MVWRCATSSTARNEDFLCFGSPDFDHYQYSSQTLLLESPGHIFQFLGQICIIQGPWIDWFEMTSLHCVWQSQILVNHWQTISLKPVISLPLSCDYKLYNVHFESFSHISLRFHLSLALDLQLLQLHALTQGAKSHQPSRRQAWLGGLTWSVTDFAISMHHVPRKTLEGRLKKNLRPSIWQPSSFHFHTPPVRNPFIIFWRDGHFLELFGASALFVWGSCWSFLKAQSQKNVKNPRDSTGRRGVASVFLARTATAGARVEMLRFDTWKRGAVLPSRTQSLTFLFTFGVLRILWQNTPPPLVTRHPLRSAMCQATFDFDLLPVFGALAAIQIMLKLRHRARHRVCLQTQVQCCSWHRHQPTITTFHHETHTGLVRKQAWALSFTWTYSTSKIHLYTFIIIYISYIFSRWNERSKDGQGMSHCNQLCYSCQSVNKKDMFCLSKYDYVNISPRA